MAEAYEAEWEVRRSNDLLKVEGYEAQYGAAKAVGGLIAFVGWVVLILGAVGVAAGISIALKAQPQGPEQVIMYGAAAFSFLFALIGLLLAGAGQLISATADNANYNGAMLALMKLGKKV